MLKVGDFSWLAQVSIKTLRYYDQMGLLAPAQVDPVRAHRYYSTGQLSRVEEEQDRLSRLTSRIRLIEQESQMTYDVILKTVPAQWVASVRETIATYHAVSALYGMVIERLGPSMGHITLPVAIWHDREYKESNVDAEAGFYLKEEIKAPSGIEVHQLPAFTAASTIHSGSYQRLPEAYEALLRWVADNGYQVAAPIRELYLHCVRPVRPDDESYVTEIQVPVQKQAA